MKTKEELNALKEEVETVSRKLAELTEEELEQVAGGSVVVKCPRDEAKIGPLCLDCPDKTLIRVTANCFEIYRCNYGFGEAMVY